MSEDILKTSDFYMLGFYLCHWWLLAIKMWVRGNYVHCKLFAENYFFFFSCIVWPGTGKSCTYHLIQASTRLIISCTETGESRPFLNTSGDGKVTLCHSPFYYWSVLTSRTFLDLLSWSLTSWSLYSPNLALSSGWRYRAPNDPSHSSLGNFQFVKVPLEQGSPTDGELYNISLRITM